METVFLPPGTRVGSWRVVSRRGGGTYGTVYQVEREGQTGAPLRALKLATSAEEPRYEREVELLSRLRHPHVPRLHDHGRWTGPSGASYPYFVMDWVEGETLYAWASRRRLTSRQALRLLAQVARALKATHEVGGLHRDVKGDNVLVREEDTHAVLVDFGAGDVSGAPRLTRETLPPGTPEYRSPESLRFEWRWKRHSAARYVAGPADDIYSLGVMAYRLVTGKYPPPVLPPEAVEATGEPGPEGVPPEEQVRLSPELAALIRQMLSVDPSARGGAAELARRLEHAVETAGSEADKPIEPRAARRQGVSHRALAGMAAGMALVLSVWGARWQTEAPHQAHQSHMEDGGSVGVADTTLPPPEEPSPPTVSRIGLEVPKKPLPGQRQSPCVRPEVEINGGCWLIVNELTPPCGDRFYEWRGRCYGPILGLMRPDTSEQP